MPVIPLSEINGMLHMTKQHTNSNHPFTNICHGIILLNTFFFSTKLSNGMIKYELYQVVPIQPISSSSIEMRFQTRVCETESIIAYNERMRHDILDYVSTAYFECHYQRNQTPHCHLN